MMYLLFLLPLEPDKVSPSLFFTQEEVQYIRKSTDEMKSSNKTLHLSGILFIDKTHWAVWINGKCFRPENQHELKNAKIDKVTSNQVIMTITDPNSQKKYSVTLLPNQPMTIILP